MIVWLIAVPMAVGIVYGVMRLGAVAIRTAKEIGEETEAKLPKPSYTDDAGNKVEINIVRVDKKER